MTIHEPATLATDYLLAALSIVCGALLACGGSAPRRWWRRALWLSGSAALVGGTFHGFGPALGEPASMLLWRATLLLLSLTSAAMALTLVAELAPDRTRRLWEHAVWAKFAVFAGVAMLHPEFVVAIMDYGLAMIALAGVGLVSGRLWRNAMLGAVLLSVLAAVVQQMQFGLGAHFNHNDLYHTIQAGAILLFFQAGKKLGLQENDLARKVRGA